MAALNSRTNASEADRWVSDRAAGDGAVSNRSAVDAFRAWATRAERARRLATMFSRKDAQAIEAYAMECEARAIQTIEKATLAPLAA